MENKVEHLVLLPVFIIIILKSHVMKIPSLFSLRPQVALLLSGSEQARPPRCLRSTSHIQRQALSWGLGGTSSPQAFSVSCGELQETRTCTGPLVTLGRCLSGLAALALLPTCLPALLATLSQAHQHVISCVIVLEPRCSFTWACLGQPLVSYETLGI